MAKEERSNPLIREVVKYGLVGVVSTVIDIVILRTLSGLGWPYWLALAVGFVGGTINGYFMNSRWTFRYKTKGQEGVKFAQFTVVSLVGLGLTELIGNSYIHYIDQSINLLGREVGPKMTGKLIAVVLVFVWNYGANKLWTFKKS